MPINYETFMKHAPRVTKTAPETRPVLQGVWHSPDGSVYVTDSVRLYKADVGHDKGNIVLAPNGEPIAGNYPDVTRLTKMWTEPKRQFEISTADLHKAIDILYTTGKATENPKQANNLLLEGNTLSFQTFDVKARYELSAGLEGEKVGLQAKFLWDAVRLFKAGGCESISVKFFGSTRPVFFESENLLILIMPLREW